MDASRRQLVLDLVHSHLAEGRIVSVEGILEITGAQGILCSPYFNFKPGVADVLVPVSIL